LQIKATISLKVHTKCTIGEYFKAIL